MYRIASRPMLHRLACLGIGLGLLGLAAASPVAGAEPRAGRSAPQGRTEAQSEPPAPIYLPLGLQAARLAQLAPARTAAPPSPSASPSPSPTAAPSMTPTEAPTQPPPSATDAPPSATPEPSPSPPPGPSPTAAADCHEALRNGDFEAGPSLWQLEVTGTRQNPGRSIQRADPALLPAHGGDYLAWLGGLSDGVTVQELSSASISTVEAERMVSARLRFWAAIVTEERADRRPNDRLEAQILRGQRGLEIPDAKLSEESFEQGYRWQVFEADLTELLTDRGASNVKLRFQNQADRSASSWFYLDDISVEVCTRRP